MELLSIGEFAKRSGLSTRALRLYDEAGLLPPARVDPHSGYRWYAVDQLERARLIVSLRHLAMPLARITAIVDSDPDAAVRRIEEFWRAAEFEHHGRRALVDELTGKRTDRYRIEVRDLPERRMLSLHRQVTPEELVLLGREFIVRRMREAAVPRVDGIAGAPFVIYHGLVTADSDGPVEWCRPVPDDDADRIAARFPDLVLRTDPAHEEVYVHRPSAQSDPEAWLVIQSLAAWTVHHGRSPAGPVRMILVPGHGAGPALDIAIPLRATR